MESAFPPNFSVITTVVNGLNSNLDDGKLEPFLLRYKLTKIFGVP